MGTYTEYRPRLSIEITEKSKNKLAKLIPHGMQKIVFQLIVDDLIELMEKHGSGKVLGTFINRDITLRDITKLGV